MSSAPVTRDDLDAAKANVHKCEDEIESIKRALGRFALGPQDDVAQPNRLDIAMLKWQGLPDELTPTPAVMLQLSSPVEEIRLDQLWDPLAPTDASTTAAADEASSKSVASFSGVETSMATLTVTVFHNTATTSASEQHHHHLEAALGSSESIDVSLWCPLDAMNPQDVYQTEWPVIITKNPSAVTTATATTTPTADEPTINVSEGGDATSETGGVEETKAEETTTTTTSSSSSAATTTTLGTVTLRVTYKPSAKDQQEALYELLNKASQRKNLALEHLRQVSLQLSRAGPADARTSGSNNANKKPTIKPGFLNQKKKPNRLVQWYHATLGPQSMTRILFPVVKNYIIFFAAVVLFHYKGQELALPAPV